MNFQRWLLATKNYFLAAGIVAVVAGGCVTSYAEADVSFQRNDNIFPVDPSERAAAGDMNGDGLVDLILTGSNGKGFTVRVRQQDGSYISGGYYLQTETITSVVVFDFDGDGKNELAAAKYGGTAGDTKNSVMIFTRSPRFRNRMTEFTTINLEDKIGVVDVVAGDFNGDDKTDLATVNLFGASASLILNSGGGVFETPQNVAAGSSPWRARVVNLDGDDADDLLLYADKSNGLFYLRGATSGKFYGSVNVFPSSSFKFFAVGDLDQDGEQDLVTSDGTSLFTYHGQGWGDFRFQQSISVGGSVAQLETADMNNDGRQDLVFVQRYPHKLVIVKNLPGDNPFSRSVESDLPETPIMDRSVIYDLNNDQKPDAAVISGNSGSITLLENVGHSAGFQVSQNELFFPDQVVGSQSVAKTIDFKNNDDMAVNVEGFTFDSALGYAGFQMNSFSCNGRDVAGKIKRILPYENCSVNISFKPQSVGDHYSTFLIKTDALDSEGKEATYQIPLKGKGLSAEDDDSGIKKGQGLSAGVVEEVQKKLAFLRSKLTWRVKSKKALQIFYSSSHTGKLKFEIQRCKTRKKVVRKCQQVRSDFLQAKAGKNTIRLSKRRVQMLGKGTYLLKIASVDKPSQATLQLRITG